MVFTDTMNSVWGPTVMFYTVLGLCLYFDLLLRLCITYCGSADGGRWRKIDIFLLSTLVVGLWVVLRRKRTQSWNSCFHSIIRSSLLSFDSTTTIIKVIDNKNFMLTHDIWEIVYIVKLESVSKITILGHKWWWKVV